MAAPPETDLTERFLTFYERYYREDIVHLAQRYPNDQRSLFVSYDDLYRFDEKLAENYHKKPDRTREYAEEALRLFEIPAEVKLGRAHVRVQGLPEGTVLDPGNIRVTDDVIGRLVTLHGYAREASDTEAKITEAAFECQRCGTMTYIPQGIVELQEPHECQGCEREGPFHLDHDQSVFIDGQVVILGPLPEARTQDEGEVRVELEDDLAGEISAGDRVDIVGVLHVEQKQSGVRYRCYLDAVSVAKLGPTETTIFDNYYLDVPPNEIAQGGLEDFVEQSLAILRTQNLNETETQSKVLTPFLHLLGWRVHLPGFRLEYSDPEVSSERADYVLLNQGQDPVFVVEAKQEGTELGHHVSQVRRYMRLFQAPHGLLSDGNRFMFFCKDPNSGAEIEVLHCELSDLVDHREMLAVYSRDSMCGDEASLEAVVEATQEEK